MYQRIVKIVALPLIVIGWIIIFFGLIQAFGGLMSVNPIDDLQGTPALLRGLYVVVQGLLFLAAGGACQLLTQQQSFQERLEQRLHALEVKLNR